MHELRCAPNATYTINTTNKFISLYNRLQIVYETPEVKVNIIPPTFVAMGQMMYSVLVQQNKENYGLGRTKF